MFVMQRALPRCIVLPVSTLESKRRPVGGTAGGQEPPGTGGQSAPFRDREERGAFQPVVAIVAEMGRTV